MNDASEPTILRLYRRLPPRGKRVAEAAIHIILGQPDNLEALAAMSPEIVAEARDWLGRPEVRSHLEPSR